MSGQRLVGTNKVKYIQIELQTLAYLVSAKTSTVRKKINPHEVPFMHLKYLGVGVLRAFIGSDDGLKKSGLYKLNNY